MTLENASSEPKVNTRLRGARLKRRWPIKTAASHADVSETTYLRWEQGIQNPHLVNLQALCNAFDLSPEQLGYGNLVTDGEITPEQTVEEEALTRLLEKQTAMIKDLRQKVRELEGNRNRLLSSQAVLRSEAERARDLERMVGAARNAREVLMQELDQANVKIAGLEHSLETLRARLYRSEHRGVRKVQVEQLMFIPEPEGG